MYRIMRDCLAIAAVLALSIWSLAPIMLLPFGLCAAGLGIGALCMHFASDFTDSGLPPSVVTVPTRTIFVSQQPTYTNSWSWNPFNWFSGWKDDRHYGYNTHNHASASSSHAYNTHRSHEHGHTAVHTHGSGSFFNPTPTSSHNTYNVCHSHEHGHR